jgi:hypothetical protein
MNSVDTQMVNQSVKNVSCGRRHPSAAGGAEGTKILMRDWRNYNGNAASGLERAGVGG